MSIIEYLLHKQSKLKLKAPYFEYIKKDLHNFVKLVIITKELIQ